MYGGTRLGEDDYKSPKQTYQDKLTDEDIEKIILEIIDMKKEIIKEKGNDSFSILMGEAMKQLRGKVDGKIVSDKIQKLLNN